MSDAAPQPEPYHGRYEGQYRPEFSRLHRDPDLLWVTPFPVRYIVGVVGARCSGKSTVLSYLSDKKGFEVYSLSSLVREEAERRGLRLDQRSVLQDLGDEMRAGHRRPDDEKEGYGDGGYLARAMLRRVHHRYHSHGGIGDLAPRIAISGFKHPSELDVFLAMHEFQILLLDADEEDRAARAQRSQHLTREIRVEGNPEVADEVDPNGDVRIDLFRQYMEARDRDGQEFNPWAGDCGQAVERLLDQARELLGKEQAEADQPGAGARKRLWSITNGTDVKLDRLYEHVDEIVRRLDSRFRAGRL